MKDGNKERFQMSGGLSLLTARLTLEGPLDEAGQGSYMIAGRRTYLDPIMRLLDDNEGSNVYFYDLNAKLSFALSSNDWLYSSAYFGKDNLDVADATQPSQTGYNLNWSNQAYNLRWNHLWSSSVFSNLSGVYSSYRSDFASGSISSKPSIRDLTARFDVEVHLSGGHFLRGGAEFTRHHIVATSGLLNGEPTEEASLTSTELHGYIGDDWTLSEQMRIQSGVNVGYFTTGNYLEADPRINVRYLVNENMSLKTSYTVMHQFIHSLSAGAFATPGDAFFPSTHYLKPERSQQISIGFMASLTPLGLPNVELSVETYYRSLSNLIMFRQKFSSVQEERLREDVIIGKGWAYGLDLELLRARGRLNGTVAYSFLVSRRQFSEKNEGRPFPPRFDRTHQINAAFNYQLGESWKAGATFVLASGTPITVPREIYFLDGQFNQWYENGATIEYGDIYSQRLPMYNRLDLSVTKSWQGWGGTWEFFVSIYNVYGYRNPLYITYSGGVFQQYSVGFVPSIGLNFQF